jgi:hypothetical protein
MSKHQQEIFVLAPCFNNYEIVSGKVMEMYVQNSKYGKNSKVTSYFADTPYLLYATQMNPSEVVLGSQNGKQAQMFIILLGLIAVCVYRMSNALCTVSINNGVVDIAGFGSLLAIANTLNKPTVLWNDDIRSSWGVSNDPLTLASRPMFYKNLYGALPPQSASTAPYNKNLHNSTTPPTMGTDVKCPVGNVFDIMINDAINSGVGKTSNSVGYIKSLIKLGGFIVDYVEKTKQGSKGWIISVNPGLYYDLFFIIHKHMDILTRVQKTFVQNMHNPFTVSTHQHLSHLNRSRKLNMASKQMLMSTSTHFALIQKGKIPTVVPFSSTSDAYNLAQRVANFPNMGKR